MPYVNIKVTDDGVTADQKAALVHVVLDLVSPENWGYDGVLSTEYRTRAS